MKVIAMYNKEIQSLNEINQSLEKKGFLESEEKTEKPIEDDKKEFQSQKNIHDKKDYLKESNHYKGKTADHKNMTNKKTARIITRDEDYKTKELNKYLKKQKD